MDGLFEFYLEMFHNISTFKKNIKYSETTGNMQLSYFNEAFQEKGRTQGPVWSREQRVLQNLGVVYADSTEREQKLPPKSKPIK